MTQTPEPTSPANGPATDSSGGPGGGSATHDDSTGSQVTGGAAKDNSAARSAKGADPLRSSRTSGFYTGVIALGILLILLIIFIVQNTDPAPVRYLGFEGSAPQAVLLLIALAAGILLTAIAGSLRLLQVRRRVKKERKR